MLNNENPYQIPQANLEEETPKEYSKLNLFSADGRLGRLRYSAHCTLLQILLSIMGVTFVFTESKTLMLFLLPFMLFLVYILICSTIKRLHDINMSGWWLLPLIVIYGIESVFPDISMFKWVSFFVLIASLIILVLTGSVGKNDYGYPPPPNTFGVYLAVIIPIVLVIIAIFAAVPMQNFTLPY